MKKYSLSKVVKYVNRCNDLKLEESGIKKVEKQLIEAGFSTVTQNRIKTVEKAILAICKKRFNPLKVTAAHKLHADSCPLCTSNVTAHLTNVKLADNREAKYCVEHNVTIPCCVD